MKKESLVKILVSLMQNPFSCPLFPQLLSKKGFNQLLKMAQLNKATTFLSHFLDCQKCRSKLPSSSFEKLTNIYTTCLAQQMMGEKEKKSLGKIFNQKQLKVVLLKDFSSYPKLYSGKIFITGDIDLLVKKNGLQKVEELIKKDGYSLRENLILKNPLNKKTFLYQEKSFFKKGKVPSPYLDLHLQIAIPSIGEFRPISETVVKSLTDEVFKHSRKRKDHFFEPEIEYFLTFLIVHYFSSDLCTCLRNLYDIIALAKLYEKQIDWQKFWRLTQRHDLQKTALFFLLLGSRVFKLSLPLSFQNQIKIPFYLKALTAKKSLESIAIFPPNWKWHNKTPALEKLFKEDFFFKAFLTEDVNLSRLMRPQIIFFFLSSVLKLTLFKFDDFFQSPTKTFFISKK
ncbi:nucleotidyltransferase family protein [Candidatus Microgenomates bacterium]|nr:nucleotidyltransferase family protein [Candidatus Microgenomates bacterium]